MAEIINAVLIDDDADSDYIQGVIQGAKSQGINITAVGDPSQVDSALGSAGASALIVDMKMPELSARKIARNATRIQPRLAIFFWSYFAADTEYADLDTSISPLVRCAKGVKFPKADTSAEVLTQSLVEPLRELVDRPAAPPLPATAQIFEGGSQPFTLTVDQFNEMSLSDARRMVDETERDTAALVAHIFANTEAEWLLIAGPERDIIRWGAALGNMPDSKRMAELGRRYGYVPYLFTRPVEVDDIFLPDAKAWAECPPGDFYPSLGADFLDGQIDTYQMHLDTGAVKTFFSYEILVAAGLLKDVQPIDIRPGKRGPAQRFQYVDREINLVLSDGSESKEVRVRAVIVFDWSDGPFAKSCAHGSCPGSIARAASFGCGRREVGLLGRDVLVEGRLQVVLDGVARKTRFLPPSEDGQERQRRRPPRGG